MSFASSPLRWRRPGRKSSTPFFPGAWPDGSSQDMTLMQEPSTHFNRRTPNQDRLEEQTLSNLDYVADFHRRISESLNSRPSISQPTLVTPSMSASSYISSFTEGASNSASPTLATPETLSPVESLSPVSKQCPSSWRNSVSHPLSTSCGHIGPLLRENSYLVEDVRATSNTGSASISPPLRLPLSLPTHTLAFSPDSAASYFSTFEHVPRTGSHELARKQISTASTVPSVVSPALSELPPIPVSTDFAQSFFPILDCSPQDVHDSSTFESSTHGVDADSPVLPSDEDHGPELSLRPRTSRRHGITQELAPSAVDMDAFAISADNVPDTNSVRSIPTSFVSDLAAGSVVDHEAFLSVATARGRTYRQSSSSLNISTNTLSLGYDHEGVYGLRGDLGSRQSRGDMQSPTRTTSCGKPVSTVVAGGTAKSNQAVKANSFAKLKVFGEKIKKAFGVRTRQAGSGIGITTTTAITAVEYKSEHPIPSPKHKSKSRDKLLQNQRRKSMPAHAREHQVSHPQPLRPTSFLAMDPRPSFGQPFSGNDNVQSGTVPWFSRGPQSRQPSGLQVLPSPNAQLSGASSEPPSAGPHRTRSSSSPAMAGPNACTKSDRLFSSESKYRLEMLKNTILPRPTIPTIPTDRPPYQATVEREYEALTTGAPPEEEDFEVINGSTSDLCPPSLGDSMRKGSATSAFHSSRDLSDAARRKDSNLQNPAKRRRRGFSFTKRASKALGSPVPPVPSLPHDLLGNSARPGKTLSTLLKGLTPQKKAEYLRRWQQQQSVGSPVECAEYDPDAALDTISSAHVPDSTRSTTTTTDDLVSSDSVDTPLHAIHMDILNGDATLGSSIGAMSEDETGSAGHDLEDREERGFLRALGLEFDIARAVEEC